MIEIRKTEEFSNWIDGLRDRSAKAIIARRIERLTLGNFGDSKAVGDSVHELRIFVGPGYRVYYTKRGSEIVILLCGGDKSTQAGDIKTAKKLAAKL